jgi:hypothetical protein
MGDAGAQDRHVQLVRRIVIGGVAATAAQEAIILASR